MTEPDLPRSSWEALARGALGRCPRCARGKLFRRFLKPCAQCTQCGQSWAFQRADDFPAYVAILVTGHLMAPVIISLVRDTDLSVTTILVMVALISLAMMIGLLQPAKGAIIALQWWFGMHGFTKERPEPGERGEG